MKHHLYNTQFNYFKYLAINHHYIDIYDMYNCSTLIVVDGQQLYFKYERRAGSDSRC